jgi:hypothetical protein
MNWVNGRHVWLQTFAPFCSVTAFVLTLLLSLGFSSLVLASDEAAQCSTQMAKTMADPILKSRVFGSLVQQNLAIIYQDNPDYQADSKGPKNMLADGRIGRITEKWLGYFCLEFNQAASVDSETDFVSQLLTALVTVAELTQNYSSWRQSLVSEEFKLWLGALIAKGQYREPSCESRPYCYGTPTQLHGLFDEFYLNPKAKQYPDVVPNSVDYYQPTTKPTTKPVSQTLSYYQFNELDIGKLTVWSENTIKFNELVGKKFSTDIEIGAALTPIVEELLATDDNKPTPQTVSDTLAALITVTPAEYQLLSPKASEPSPDELNPDEPSSEDKATNQTSPKASSSDNSGVSSTEASTKEGGKAAEAAVIPPAPVPTTQVLTQPQTYEVSRDTADKWLTSLGRLSLNETQLAKLSSLTGSVFLDDYLFSIAIKELALELEESQLLALNTLAHKEDKLGQDTSTPLVWQASPGCGCTENSIIEDGNERPYYGFYPYWQQETDARIDYSHLTRMGFFSAVIQGPQLLLPNNWRADKAHSQFAINAQNHRVKVDLVFSSHGEEVARSSKGWPYNQAMVEQIIAAVKTPITGNMINRIKPIISLGTSPSRTLGDGVTLNLDLKEINSQEQVDEFIDFIKRLKRGLNSNASSNASSGANSSASDMARPTDEYYLNLMVPAYELEAETSWFYTVDNLAKIEPYINIFIVNFSPLSNLKASTQTTSENDSVASLKAFRTLLGEAQYSDSAGKIFAKVIPFIRVNDADSKALPNVVDYTQWSYLGAAFWTIPLSAQAATLIEKSYFPAKPLMFPFLKPVVELADRVCKQVCPLRWPLRLVFLVVVLIVVIYAIASWWIFSLRQLFSRWYFLVFLLLASLFIMLVFGCDPYWQQQQQLFLFIFILGIFGYNFFRQLAIKRRGSLP